MNDAMIRVSCVSYLNSLPFLHGLRNHDIINRITLSLDTPAECAQKLVSGEAHLGLVPVAVIPQISHAEIISDYCIGANGPVNSVMLFSNVPLHEIKEGLLDYQSRTSVNLVQILAREHWKITPRWIRADRGFEQQVAGETAAVIIGDRALKLKNQFPFVYDLSEEWKKMTGLPFVFACWVSNTRLPSDFVSDFNNALAEGISDPDKAVTVYGTGEISQQEAVEYLKENIDYHLDAAKRKAMDLFLSKITENETTFAFHA